MKKTLLICVCIVSLLFVVQTVSARGIPVIYSNGLTCEVKEKLPEEAIIDGSHVDFGISFDQFAIFWIPLWNYGTTNYAYIDKAHDTVYEIDTNDSEEAGFLKENYNIDITKAPKISFWNAIGGKLIALAVIALLVWGSLKSKKDDKEKEAREIEELKRIEEEEAQRAEPEETVEEEAELTEAEEEEESEKEGEKA
ncbi:MAG: hypothetical protein LBO74_03275 [Candidatus Symbiothrix sp.]|jgi:hypothetical protein|nr:hypothetical protein [Candidatus Symbiothrix sp.]